MNCEPFKPTDPCDDPCPLQKLPKGILAPMATQIINDNIDKLNCVLCPDTSVEANPDVVEEGVLVVDLSANDVNPEGTPLGPVTSLAGQTVTPGGSITVPEGTLELAADGVTVTFVPGPGYAGGPVAFAYVMTDADGDDDPSTVTFTVNPPVADPIDVGEVAAGGELTGDLTTVTTAGSDPTLNYSLDAADPKASNITLNPDGTFTVDTTGLAVEECSVEYTVTDGNGLTDTSTITWTVLENTVVAIDDGPFDLPQGGTITFSKTVNDSDPEGDTFTVTEIDGQPVANAPFTISGLTITDNGDGTCDATAPSDQPISSVVFEYTIEDSNGASDIAEVTINVTETPNLFFPVGGDETDNVGEQMKTALDNGETVQLTLPDGTTVFVGETPVQNPNSDTVYADVTALAAAEGLTIGAAPDCLIQGAGGNIAVCFQEGACGVVPCDMPVLEFSGTPCIVSESLTDGSINAGETFMSPIFSIQGRTTPIDPTIRTIDINTSGADSYCVEFEGETIEYGPDLTQPPTNLATLSPRVAAFVQHSNFTATGFEFARGPWHDAVASGATVQEKMLDTQGPLDVKIIAKKAASGECPAIEIPIEFRIGYDYGYDVQMSQITYTSDGAALPDLNQIQGSWNSTYSQDSRSNGAGWVSENPASASESVFTQEAANVGTDSLDGDASLVHVPDSIVGTNTFVNGTNAYSNGTDGEAYAAASIDGAGSPDGFHPSVPILEAYNEVYLGIDYTEGNLDEQWHAKLLPAGPLMAACGTRIQLRQQVALLREGVVIPQSDYASATYEVWKGGTFNPLSISAGSTAPVATPFTGGTLLSSGNIPSFGTERMVAIPVSDQPLFDECDETAIHVYMTLEYADGHVIRTISSQNYYASN